MRFLKNSEDRTVRIYVPSQGGMLRQGEFISDLREPIAVSLDEGTATVEIATHPYSLIITQDCDLESDYRARTARKIEPHRLLPNVLFCQVFTAEELKGRNQLSSRLWNPIKKNKEPRYQFFQRVPLELDALQEGLPEMGVDFKRHFTMPTELVYSQIQSGVKRRCRLTSPYLEHFSLRFHSHQARVALPEDHFSE